MAAGPHGNAISFFDNLGLTFVGCRARQSEHWQIHRSERANMKLKARGLISDAARRPDSERISYFTALCPLRSGAFLAGFQLGAGKHAPDNTIRLCRSIDAGRTWSDVPFRFETAINGIPGSLAGGEMVE